MLYNTQLSQPIKVARIGAKWIIKRGLLNSCCIWIVWPASSSSNLTRSSTHQPRIHHHVSIPAHLKTPVRHLCSVSSQCVRNTRYVLSLTSVVQDFSQFIPKFIMLFSLFQRRLKTPETPRYFSSTPMCCRTLACVILTTLYMWTAVTMVRAVAITQKRQTSPWIIPCVCR